MARKKTPGASRGKNLIRKDGYIINQYGVRIPEEQARQLENAVRRVNRRREKQIAALDGRPIMMGTKQLAADPQQLRLMGQQADLIMVKRSASLNQFTDKRSFNRYLKATERASTTDYMAARTKLYKQNLVKAIEKNFPGHKDLTKGIAMKIRTMKHDEFLKFVGSNWAFEIKNQYITKGSRSMLNDMREALGLKRKDEIDDDLDEEYFDTY